MSITFYWDQLKTIQARTYYSIVFDSVKANIPLAHIPLPILNDTEKSNDAFDALCALKLDHPEFFYVSNHAQTQLLGQVFSESDISLYTDTDT